VIRISKGQISIDYAGGAMLFFLSLIFVTTGVLGTVPQFTDVIQEDRLEVTAWSFTTSLLEENGYWETATASGEDWHRHTGNVKNIGLSDGKGIDRAKTNAFLSLDYRRIKNQIAKMEKDFNMEITEYGLVYTDQTFPRGNPPAKLTGFVPPNNPSYTSADSTVHYGSIELNEEAKYFLVTFHANDPDSVYVSDSWNFSGSSRQTFGDNRIFNFNGRNYRLDMGNSGITTSEGNLIVLSRLMGRIGERPPVDTQRVVQVRRVTNIGHNPVTIETSIWN